jgi:hypothetical protein
LQPISKNLDDKVGKEGERGNWGIFIAIEGCEAQTQNPNMGAMLTSLRLNK